MPQGLEHVEGALELIERATAKIASLGGAQGDWGTEASTRLASTAALLRTTKERFFLKTKVSLPFARKCEDEARALDALLADLSAQPTPDGQGGVRAALEALEKAAKTLDERSQMRGMTIA